MVKREERYIHDTLDHFEILKRVGKVAYRLILPPKMSGVYNVFHISMLRRIVHDSSHKINFKDIEVNDNETYHEAPVNILEQGVKKLRTKKIPVVKVRGSITKIWNSMLEIMCFSRYLQ